MYRTPHTSLLYDRYLLGNMLRVSIANEPIIPDHRPPFCLVDRKWEASASPIVLSQITRKEYLPLIPDGYSRYLQLLEDRSVHKRCARIIVEGEYEEECAPTTTTVNTDGDDWNVLQRISNSEETNSASSAAGRAQHYKDVSVNITEESWMTPRTNASFLRKVINGTASSSLASEFHSSLVEYNDKSNSNENLTSPSENNCKVNNCTHAYKDFESRSRMTGQAKSSKVDFSIAGILSNSAADSKYEFPCCDIRYGNH